MNSDRWQKLKSILAEALEQESPSARSAVIGRSCADDVDLLHEFESLMAEADETDPFEGCAESMEIAIHRDLKPNNILVNREGEPKLLDFGIAKVIGGRTNPLEITSFRQQRLTPTSASPEQVKGEPITVFSDIYALGAVLYEMVTGVRP